MMVQKSGLNHQLREVGSWNPIYVAKFYTSQVVQNFWTINSMKYSTLFSAAFKAGDSLRPYPYSERRWGYLQIEVPEIFGENSCYDLDISMSLLFHHWYQPFNLSKFDMFKSIFFGETKHLLEKGCPWNIMFPLNKSLTWKSLSRLGFSVKPEIVTWQQLRITCNA